MSTPSASDLITIRKPNQATDLYLGIYQPPVVEHGRVFPDAQIQGLPSELADNYYIAGFTATNVATSGTVKNGMTLVFGSAAGLEDLGRTFVRGKSGTHYDFSVIENMPLVSGIYYRVYDFFELWPVFPRVTVTDENVITYYKDYDKLYNNQNSVFTPVAVVGPNTAAFVENVSGQKTMTFVSTGSYTVDGTAISNVYWEINTNPVTILTGSTVSYTFPRSGHYTVETRVINANSVTGTAHRHYILLNREGFVNTPYNPPIKDWKFESLDGGWDSGGWQCKFSVGDDADDLRDGALVVIFAEDFYDDVKQSFGGYADRENILFSGYIDKVDDTNVWHTSRSTFSAKSAINLLQNRDMFSVSLQTSPNPIDWTEIKNMTINRIIDHYLRWHSTFLDVCDYRPCVNTTSGAYPEQYEDIPRGEIFNNVRNIMGSRLLANFVSDKQGRVFSEVNLNYIITGSRPSAVLTFQSGDWIDKLKIVEDLEFRTSSVLFGGVSYDSNLNTGSAYLSRAPDALFPLHFGKAETKSGQTIDTQTTLNNLCGLYLAGNNPRFPSLGMSMTNNIRTIDIIPQEFYQLPSDYPFTDEDLRNLRGTWANRRFIPRRINYTLKGFTLQQEVVYETETHGPAGETIRIPAQPPDNGTPEPPEPPGQTAEPDPPGPLGSLDWAYTLAAGKVYDVAWYSTFVYACGVITALGARVEKRAANNGDLYWKVETGDVANFLDTAYSLEVNANGIFVCGNRLSGGRLVWVVIKLNDSDGSVAWQKEVSHATNDYAAYSLDIDDTFVYVVGAQKAAAVDTNVLEKRNQSDGNTAMTTVYLSGTATTTNIDEVSGELYLGRYKLVPPSSQVMENRTVTVGALDWSASVVDSQRTATRYADSAIYAIMYDDVSPDAPVTRLLKRNTSGGTVWFISDLEDYFLFETLQNPDVGTNYFYFCVRRSADLVPIIFLGNKSTGATSEYGELSLGTTIFTIAIRLNGLIGYFGGYSGSVASPFWHIERRTLPFT